MSAEKTVNGYVIKQIGAGNWWMCSAAGEQVAGPFPSEKMAAEVAAVFEDTPPPPRRRGDSRDN
ncbi:MAG: hypothetical protein AAGC84_03130 [Pseudomonas sp.]